MTTDLIQADYDQLTAIAHRFAQQAAAIEQMQSQLRQGLTPLQQGDWLGRGAAAFFAEMTQETLPAVGRLHAALAEAGRVTQEIIQMMQQAEEEAARPFQGASEAGSGGNQTPDQAAIDPTAKPLSENNTATLSGQLPARKSTQEIFSKS